MTNIERKVWPLRLSEEERAHIETLRKNALNVSQFLRLCLKRKAVEFEKEGMK